MAKFDQFLDRQHDRAAALLRSARTRRIGLRKLAPAVARTRAPRLRVDASGNRLPAGVQGPLTKRQTLGGLFRAGSPENIAAMGAAAIQNPLRPIFGGKDSGALIRPGKHGGLDIGVPGPGVFKQKPPRKRGGKKDRRAKKATPAR